MLEYRSRLTGPGIGFIQNPTPLRHKPMICDGGGDPCHLERGNDDLALPVRRLGQRFFEARDGIRARDCDAKLAGRVEERFGAEAIAKLGEERVAGNDDPLLEVDPAVGYTVLNVITNRTAVVAHEIADTAVIERPALERSAGHLRVRAQGRYGSDELE